MAKESDTYKIISVILFIAVITFAGLYFTKTSSSEEVNEQTCAEFIDDCPQQEEKALVTAYMGSWGENLYDSSKILFTVNVFNYGYAEARNVELICKVFDADEDGVTLSDIPIATFTKKIGNLASTSYDYNELDVDRPSGMDLNSLALCNVNSCDNCEILDDRVPEEDIL